MKLYKRSFMNEQLRKSINDWDGKSAEKIRAVYLGYSTDDDFIDQVLVLIPQAETGKGATWLLKHYLKIEENSLGPDHVVFVLNHLESLDHWESKVHVLQCLQDIHVPDESVPELEMFLRQCFTGEVIFVRAWAYSGFHTLAKQFPEYREECNVLLQEAMERESAASIRARIRLCLKEGF